jgi:hypothetical protein
VRGPNDAPAQATDLQMSQKEVYEFNVPTFGKGVVFDVGHQERAEQFRFFSESLKTARLQTYVQLMVKEAEAFFKERLKDDAGEVRAPRRAACARAARLLTRCPLLLARSSTYARC